MWFGIIYKENRLSFDTVPIKSFHVIISVIWEVFSEMQAAHSQGYENKVSNNKWNMGLIFACVKMQQIHYLFYNYYKLCIKLKK